MEDAHIVDLYWARSESAVAETAKKYGTYCYSIAHAILTNPEDAEESVNDTWLDAWNSMPSGHSGHISGQDHAPDCH